MTQETTALVKAEKKTTAVAKVDPNRVQFVWDPVTRSMKRVGGPAEEVNADKKEDAQKADATEMMEMLRQQYDGYHFSSKMTDIFNPFSLLNAFKNQSMDSYWFRSGTSSIIFFTLPAC